MPNQAKVHIKCFNWQKNDITALFLEKNVYSACFQAKRDYELVYFLHWRNVFKYYFHGIYAFPPTGETEDKEMFGPHLTMDMYGCNRKKLKDVNFVYSFLDELPNLVGMTKIMPPYTFSYNGVKPEDWGVSGIVLIAESHISIHTFPEKGYASVDIFSCKEFDVESGSDIIASKFEAKTYERNFLMRGRHFPKDIARSRQIIELEREREGARSLPPEKE